MSTLLNGLGNVIIRTSDTRRRFLDAESGMTLIEVLVAMFILAVAVVALASTAVSSLSAVRLGKDRQNATQLASTVLEEVRGLPFEDVILDTADGPPALYNAVTNSTCATQGGDCEVVVRVAGGAVDHVRTSGKLTATTYVTEVTGSASRELRVTVVVTWTGTTGDHTVRQQTLVAEATRGLPAPSFTVTPTSPTETGVETETICFDHTLNNTGEKDKYSWQLFGSNQSTGVLEPGQYQTRTVNEPDDSGNVTSESREGFRVQSTSEGAHWFGWALFAVPSTGSLQPMTDTTSDLRPDSPVEVAAFGSARVRFCYTPLSQAGVKEATATNPTLTPRVYSAFDETVTTASQGNEITNTIQVVSPNTSFFLHEDGDGNVTHPLNTDSTMNWPDGTDYETLPSAPGDGIPGLRVEDAPEQVWFFTFGALSELSNPSLTFYVRTDDDEDETLAFDLELVHRDGSTITSLSQASITVSPVGTAWQQVTVALPLTSPQIFDNGDNLEVLLRCDEETSIDPEVSSDECHVNYDQPATPSVLQVELQ